MTKRMEKSVFTRRMDTKQRARRVRPFSVYTDAPNSDRTLLLGTSNRHRPILTRTSVHWRMEEQKKTPKEQLLATSELPPANGDGHREPDTADTRANGLQGRLPYRSDSLDRRTLRPTRPFQYP